MARTGIDPHAIDDVVWGCTETIGGQAGDIGRTAWLVAGLPEEVPGVTIDRQCGSSQQAVHFAAQGVMSGTQDLVVAGGSQAMNQIPIMAAMLAGKEYGFDNPFYGSTGWVAALRDRRGRPDSLGRDDRRQMGHHARGDGAFCAHLAPARAGGDRPGLVRERNRASRRLHHRRDGAAQLDAGRHGGAQNPYARAAPSPPASPAKIPMGPPPC